MSETSMVPPLPLSQQIAAWVLRALGHGDEPGPGVSRGTLRNAQDGKPIPEAWVELVAVLLRRLGIRSPTEDVRATIEALLRRWDLMVSELPPAGDLSTEERLHAPLACAIPAVGVRLGALAATVALATRKPLEEWSWIVEPLDEKLFGKVVRALSRRRFPDQTIEKIKARLEHRAKNPIDRRTIERWLSGATKPNRKSLATLVEVLGPEAEPMLRAARLVVMLRKELRASIGAEAMAEWARIVAHVGWSTAEALCDPEVMAGLLRRLREDLEEADGEALCTLLRSLMPAKSKPARPELAKLLARAADHIEAEGRVAHPVARWISGCTVLVVLPRFEMGIWGALGGNLLGFLAMKDLPRHIRRDWPLRAFMKAVASGTMAFQRADGSPVERPISGGMQEIARRWQATSLQFTRTAADDDPTLDQDLAFLLYHLAGPDRFAQNDHDEPPPIDLLGMLIDPTAEEALPDDQVRASLPLSLARARRLLKSGDWDGAVPWLPDLRTRRGPLSDPELDGLLATYAEITHHILDLLREPRGLFRVIPAGDHRDRAREALLDSVRIAERLVEQLHRLGEAPEGTSALLDMLVHAIPAAVRIMTLREELEAQHEGLTPEAVRCLVEQLARCVEKHATHGRGWALLALGRRLRDDGKAAAHAENQARHFGAEHVLEDEWARLRADVGCAGEDTG